MAPLITNPSPANSVKPIGPLSWPGKVLYGLRKVSDVLVKVLDCPGKVPDGLVRVSDGPSRESV